MPREGIRPLKDVVKKVIEDLSSTEGFKKKDILKEWPRLVGGKAKRHTKPISIRRGRLVVNVDESSWLYELNLNKENILKKINERFGEAELKEIRFRIGDIE